MVPIVNHYSPAKIQWFLQHPLLKHVKTPAASNDSRLAPDALHSSPCPYAAAVVPFSAPRDARNPGLHKKVLHRGRSEPAENSTGADRESMILQLMVVVDTD